MTPDYAIKYAVALSELQNKIISLRSILRDYDQD